MTHSVQPAANIETPDRTVDSMEHDGFDHGREEACGSADVAPEQAQLLPNDFPLRSDLVLHDQETERYQVLEDLSKNAFYRLGRNESCFVSHLMKSGDAEAAFQSVSTGPTDERETMSRKQANRLCSWLLITGLTELKYEGKLASPPAKKSILVTPFFAKLPLLNPDKLLTRLAPKINWAVSWHASLVGLCIALFAVLLTTGRWSEFYASYDNLFTSWRWISLLAIWCGLKVLHELFHAATCKRYGGTVPVAGVAFILLMPIAFVDVTSCWRFPARWQRLHVTLAGVIGELFIAGVALIAWNLTSSLVWQQVAADVVLLASVSSLVFNLNPLLKFDGYYALSDATGVDNLYDYGHRYSRYWVDRYLLGLREKQPDMPRGHGNWVKTFGLMAAVWRVLTLIALTCAAATIFHGAGVAIATAGAIVFFVRPLVNQLVRIWKMWREDKLLVGRFAVRMGLIAGVLTALLFGLPTELRRTVPAIVEYDPPAVVRAPIEGFIESVLVNDGELVEAGQLLLTMRNDNLAIQLSAARKELVQIEQEVRAAQWNRDSTLFGDAQSRQIAVRQLVDELVRRAKELEVRAPTAGRVVSRNLQTLQGTYIREGVELAAVGNEFKKRVKISLGFHESSQMDRWQAELVRISLTGQPSILRKVDLIESRASNAPPDPALCAPSGGSLPVLQNEQGEYVLSEPRLNAFVSLDESTSSSVRCGQRCWVRLGCHNQSIGSWLISCIEIGCL